MAEPGRNFYEKINFPKLKMKSLPGEGEGFFGSIGKLHWFYMSCLKPLWSLFNFELDRLTFLKGAKPVRFDGAVVDENIRTAFACEEAVALRRIEPFDRTGHTICHFIASPYEKKE
jgi:hypothetical protein